MRYKVQPEDFTVEEWMRLPLAPRGHFAIYRVRKRGVTTLSVQVQMARALEVPQSAILFPALKDKDAVAIQHVAVRGTGPARLTGKGFLAEFLGRSYPTSPPCGIIPPTSQARSIQCASSSLAGLASSAPISVTACWPTATRSSPWTTSAPAAWTTSPTWPGTSASASSSTT
nr:tRNA pseudouridine(13) synthase TruD [Anaerolineae bacterium]